MQNTWGNPLEEMRMKLPTVKVNSDNKNETYVATVLLFNNVRQMAMHKIGGWALAESVTDNEGNYFISVYKNGKMHVTAESHGDHHAYSFGAIED